MRKAAWGFIAAVALTASTAQAQDAAVRTLVERFETARRAHDPVALAKTLAPDYEEISPIGAVDSRDAVLGFYAPALKTPAPEMTDDEVAVRSSGDIAIVTLRTSFALPDTTRRSLRVRYVARRTGGVWRLASAQYTPIPPARGK